MDTPADHIALAEDAANAARKHLRMAQDATARIDPREAHMHHQLAEAHAHGATLHRNHARLLRQADPKTQAFMQNLHGGRTTYSTFGAR